MTPWTSDHSAALLAAPLVALNYHDIAHEHRRSVDQRLRAVADLGPSFDPDAATPGGPRVFVGFWDGYREASLFGAEACHRLGLRAYFFPVFSSPDPPRGTLTDDDLAQISSVHEVGFHTFSHLEAAAVSPANGDLEVTAVVERIEAITGACPRLAAWKSGSRCDLRTWGDRRLRDLGVRHWVSNWSIEAAPVIGPKTPEGPAPRGAGPSSSS